MATPTLRRSWISALVLATIASACAVALVTPTVRASAATPAAGVRVVDSCNQDVAPGHFACLAERRADLGFQARRPAAAAAAVSGYGPSALQDAYGLTSAASVLTSQRVYVVDAYDDPTAEQDLARYRSNFGLPECTTVNGCFQKLNQNGAASPLPRTDTGWSQEIALDLQMVSAICPQCDITLVEASDSGNGLFTAVRTATNLGAKFVSMSWGGSEDGNERYYDSHYFAASGVVYTASTGDDGYAGHNGEGVSYPATSPHVVAVGGTSLTRAAGGSRDWTEAAWSGAGSGCSGSEAQAVWQSGVVPAACAHRATADVSAVADPRTGVAVYTTTGGSGWSVYGGTSASAPIIAAAYALAGTPRTDVSPASLPYLHTDQLNDVTSGSTGSCSPSALCTAGSGWDGPTGLGTPNGIGAFGGTVTPPSTPGAAPISTPTPSSTPTPTPVATPTPNPISVVTRAPVSCSGNRVSNPGFESGSAGWRATGKVIKRSKSLARRGTRFAQLDGYGHRHRDTLTKTISIPRGCRAVLRYYLRVSSSDRSKSAHDVLTVTASGTRIGSFSNRSRTSRYALHTVSLSSYAGRTITLTFRGVENKSRATSFRLDDVSVTLSR